MKYVIDNKNRDERMYTEIPAAFRLCATKENVSDLWKLLEPVYDDVTLAKLFLNIVKTDNEKLISDKEISTVVDKLIVDSKPDYIDVINELILSC